MKAERQIATERERQDRIAQLEAKPDKTMAEETELDQLLGNETRFPADDPEVAAATPTVSVKRTRTAKPKSAEKPASEAYHLKLTFDPNDSDRKQGTFEVLRGDGQIESAAIHSLQSSLILVVEAKPKRFKLTAE